MSLLSLRGVDVAYGDLPALTGVDLVIESGEILCVVDCELAAQVAHRRALASLQHPEDAQGSCDAAKDPDAGDIDPLKHG